MNSSIKRREWLKASLITSAAGFGLLNGINVFGKPLPEEAFSAIADGEVRRLLFNENPIGPSEKVGEIIKKMLPRANKYATFHEYDFNALKNLIAKQEGLKPENVLLGHGSFEPLLWVAEYFGSNGGEIIVPSPTFDVVGNYGKKIGASIKPIEVDKDFKMDLSAMESAVGAKTKLVTICNPNNPTGTSCKANELTSFCKSVSDKSYVLIDEAYIHYIKSWRKQTMAPLIAKGRQVLVARTFSKIYSMAGLRIGYLLGPADLIKTLESKHTLGFPGNMPNTLSVAAAIASLSDNDNFLSQSRSFNEDRKADFYRFLDEQGIPYIRSNANFVYYDVQKFKAYKQLMWESKILLAGGWPTKSNWARVTMGSVEDMDFLKDQMKGTRWL